MTEQTVYMVGVPVILAMIAIELAVSLSRGRRFYEWSDTWGSTGLLVGNALVALAVKALSVGSFYLFYEYRLWTLSDMLPTWALWLIAFVTIETASPSRSSCL